MHNAVTQHLSFREAVHGSFGVASSIAGIHGTLHPTIDIHIEVTTEHSACKETSLF
jgi:hypothetical protein